MVLTEFDNEKYEANLKAEAKEEGLKEGLKKGRAEVAKKMLENNVDFEKISQYTGLSFEEVTSLFLSVKQEDRV